MIIDPSLDCAVFLGPSLPVERAQKLLDANFFPPVRHGDFYRLKDAGIQRFIVIDGVFNSFTPVWHREILEVLNEGYTVVGAASMGALRACELAPYGMRGIGTIFRWYQNGIISGDDEVALLHTDAEFGYQALSEPLVNLRYNTERAVRADVISEGDSVAAIARMKELYFGERTLASLTDAMNSRHREDFKAFVREHWVDLKAHDAEQALQMMGTIPTNDVSPADVSFFRRSSSTRTEQLMPVRYGAVLIGNRLVPNSELLQVLEERQAEYENDYRMVEELFFLECAVGRLAKSVIPLTGQPTACPETRVLQRNGLGLKEWQVANDVQMRIELKLTEILSQQSQALETIATEPENLRQAARNLLIGQWVLDRGLYPVVTPRADPTIIACRAGAWAMEQGPSRLGFSWNPLLEVFKHLQLTDRVSELLP